MWQRKTEVIFAKNLAFPWWKYLVNIYLIKNRMFIVITFFCTSEIDLVIVLFYLVTFFIPPRCPSSWGFLHQKQFFGGVYN